MKNTREIIVENKLIAIIRGISTERIVDTAKALYAGGVRLMEVTVDQSSSTGIKDTSKAIEAISKEMGDKICVGAGTVMSVEQVDAAIDAGAKYIISPNIRIDVMKRSIVRNAVSMPGALTPTEIAMAYDAGAGFVKVFPAGALGISYIKAVRSPISHIPLMAVGGVNADNMMKYLEAGVKGVGIGSNIVNRELINAGQYEELTKLAKTYTEQLVNKEQSGKE